MKERTTRLAPPQSTRTSSQRAMTPHERATTSDAATLPSPGSQLGRYVIEAELGRGGMGVVYRAFDPQLQRHVALKLMLGTATSAAIRRFRDEAHATAQLQHPSIVPIYDVGQTDGGEPYYTMRLVRGPTLAQVVAEHRAQLADAAPDTPEGWTRFRLLQVFVTVCRSVSYAHDRGVVHRDLKPSNIMIGAYGEVNVLDWGLAKLMGHSAQEGVSAVDGGSGDHSFREGAIQAGPWHQTTQSGAVVGTPAFMAPEQAAGHGEEVGFAADVYSLGAILYFVLTGTPPREGASPPPAPRSSDPGVSPDLEELCMRALENAPSARLASATLFADAVESYLEGRSLATPRVQDAEFLRGYSSRHYRRPSVTADVAVMTIPNQGRAKVGLLHRTHPPFKGAWACPGTFVRMEEPLEDTAKRVLHDKVGDPQLVRLVQVGAFGNPERDPRTRVITVAYLALVDDIFQLPEALGRLAWFDVEESGERLIIHRPDDLRDGGDECELAFDHADLLREAFQVAKQISDAQPSG